MTTTKKQSGSMLENGNEKPKRRRVKVKAGQLVAIPLQDGTFALGHVAHYLHHVTLAHFAHRAATPEGLLDGLEEAIEQKLVAMLDITNVDIYDGNWPVIGMREPHYPPAMLDMKGFSAFSSLSYWLLGAYYGLVPWDGMKDPRFYEKLLLPGVPVPPRVRYKRDFEQDAAKVAEKAAVAVSAEETSEPEITEGPGEIHIEIRYEGEGLPSIPLLKRRQAVEDAITTAQVGEITDAGGGGGVMDIYVETEDVARALPIVRAAIQAANFEGCTRIEVNPLDEEEGEEDAR